MQGVERIFFLFFVFCIISHISACFWVLIAKFEGLHEGTWIVRYGLQDHQNAQVIEFLIELK
jgi:hypothetical protein